MRQGPVAQALQAGDLETPTGWSLQLHNLNIGDVIIFFYLPIQLSLIIFVTIQIASVRAEMGRGFTAPMNLTATSILRQKSRSPCMTLP